MKWRQKPIVYPQEVYLHDFLGFKEAPESNALIKVQSINIVTKDLEKLPALKWKILRSFIFNSVNVKHIHLKNKIEQTSSTRLDELFASFADCQHLEEIKISCNVFNLTQDSFKSLGQGLVNCHNLKKLTIENTNANANIYIFPEKLNSFLQDLGMPLAQCKQLTSLTLNNIFLDKFSVEQIKKLGNILQSCDNLEELILPNARLHLLTFEQWQAFQAALTKCKKLKAINLNNNKFLGLDKCEEFANFLAHHQLISIDLSANELITVASNELQALEHLLSADLQELNISNNYLGTFNLEQALAFWIILGKCKNLRKLNLSQNHFNIFENFPLVLAIMKNAFKNFEKLEELDISSNNLGSLNDEQWDEFCNMLAKLPSLRKINLSHNNLINLNESRLQKLQIALSKCPRLAEINLDDNQEGDWREWGNFCQNINTTPHANIESYFSKLISIKLPLSLPLNYLETIYARNSQIVNLPTNPEANDLAINNRLILLRHYALLIASMSGDKKPLLPADIINKILKDYVGIIHRKVLNGLLYPSKPLLFITQKQYQAQEVKSPNAIIIKDNAESLLKPKAKRHY